MKNRGIEPIIDGAQAALKTIKEGARLRDKIVLFLSIFYSLYRYLLNKIQRRSIRLCYYLWRDCLIKNRSGVFNCRAQVNDVLIVSEAHELQLRHYFEEIYEGNFVDIGAHVGKYTVQVARQLQDRGTVISIEAHPGNFSALTRNIELNGLNNIIALNIACYSENGVVKLFQDSSSTATSSYSVVKKFREDHILVEAKKLDDILKELKIDTVDFMKIDVEHAEPEVLKSAEELLEQGRILKIIFEGSRKEIVDECTKVLEQKGYTVRDIEIGYCLAEPKLISDSKKVRRPKMEKE